MTRCPQTASAMCVDAPGWDNFYGYTCSDYENKGGWCANGAVVPDAEWTTCKTFNYPELSCCACGRRQQRQGAVTRYLQTTWATIAWAGDETRQPSESERNVEIASHLFLLFQLAYTTLQLSSSVEGRHRAQFSITLCSLKLGASMDKSQCWKVNNLQCRGRSHSQWTSSRALRNAAVPGGGPLLMIGNRMPGRPPLTGVRPAVTFDS
eukprot:g46609.t1